jgi:hypothetical protein
MAHHSIRERVTRRQIKLHYIRSKDNIADIFTKALPRKDFDRLRLSLGLR